MESNSKRKTRLIPSIRPVFVRCRAVVCVAGAASRDCVPAPIPEQTFPDRRPAFPRDGAASSSSGRTHGFHHLLEPRSRLHESLLVTPGNALMGYVLVPTVLSGAHEWTAHLTQLMLVWIAIVAMTSLVPRFGWDRRHAIVGALLLVAIAPFLPISSTAMPDILATAVALVAMERLAAWKAGQKWSQGAAAGIALGFAAFARAHLSLLLPLAAFCLFENADPREFLTQVRRKFWLWTPVLVGSALLAVFIAITREHNLAITPPPVFTGLQNIRPNLFAYLAYFVFPFPLAACWLANRLKSGPVRIVIILTVAAGATWFFHPLGLRVSFLAFIGFGVLTDLLYEALDRADHTGLFLMLWILIPLPIVYYGHLPSKYLLPCMPAILLLCFRLIEGFSVQFFRAAAVVLIVASTGYSLLILRSDAEFAKFGRDALYRLIRPHVAAGERVWFEGQFQLIGMLLWPGRHSHSRVDLNQSAEICWWWACMRVGISGVTAFPTSYIGGRGNTQVSVRKNHGSWNWPLHKSRWLLAVGVWCQSGRQI